MMQLSVKPLLKLFNSMASGHDPDAGEIPSDNDDSPVLEHISDDELEPDEQAEYEPYEDGDEDEMEDKDKDVVLPMLSDEEREVLLENSDARVHGQGRTGSEPVQTLSHTVLTQTASVCQPSSAQGQFRLSQNWEGAEPVQTRFKLLNRLPSRVHVQCILPIMSFFSRLASNKELQGVTDKVGSWVNG